MAATFYLGEPHLAGLITRRQRRLEKLADDGCEDFIETMHEGEDRACPACHVLTLVEQCDGKVNTLVNREDEMLYIFPGKTPHQVETWLTAIPIDDPEDRS